VGQDATSQERASGRKHRLLATTDVAGLHYAAEILIGTSLLWFLLRVLAASNPLWAMSAMVAVSEPEVRTARAHFRSRLFQTFVGGIIGFAFLLAAGPRERLLPLATAATALISFYVARVRSYWRVGPVAAALVMVASLTENSRRSGAEAGLHRLLEVFLGSVMAVGVSFVISRVWPLPAAPAREA
jgi:uncharacterized membrane protein YccC